MSLKSLAYQVSCSFAIRLWPLAINGKTLDIRSELGTEEAGKPLPSDARRRRVVCEKGFSGKIN